MPGGAGTGLRSVEPDEHRPAGRIANVAHRPVAALAPPIGQVMAADRLGITGEAVRQFGSVAGHHATPRSAMRTTGWRSKSVARTPVPSSDARASAGSFRKSAPALCCVEAVNRLGESAQSQMRNITFGATYSVLCCNCT